MRIPIRTHYALKVLLDLVAQGRETTTSVAAIAARQRVPRQFLHQILLALKSAGIVKSKRGLHGGYFLAQAPSEISLGAVIQATQGDLLSPPANDRSRTEPVEKVLLGVWETLCETVQAELAVLTIQDLRARVDQEREQNDYSI